MEKEKAGMNGSGSEEEIGSEEEYGLRETIGTEEEEELDPDDYRSGIRLDLTKIKVSQAQASIEIRMPKRTEWLRCYGFVERVYLLADEEDFNSYYLVHRSVVEELPEEFTEYYLVLCLNSAGRLFLWPIKISDGNQDFVDKALKHARAAQTQWMRRKFVRKEKSHKADFVDDLDGVAIPEWPPDLSMKKVLSQAFPGKVIKSFDHPKLSFLKALKGRSHGTV